MQISGKGIDFIKQWESFVPHAYNDGGGVMTLGYGHVIKPEETFKEPISQEHGIALLKTDLEPAEKAVKQYVKVPLTQSQYDALVSFAFNCGGQALAESTLLAFLNKGMVMGAAMQFQKWSKDNGERIKGLLRRRLSEALLFLS